MSKLFGASVLVFVGLIALLFAVGMLVILRLHLPPGFGAGLAAGFSLFMVLLQYCLGPMILDWIVKVHWTSPLSVSPKFATWMSKSCTTFRIDEPRFGIIEEAAPNAFTYGHGAYDARVVITRGLINILTEDELEAVVAHELGHIKHRDFIVMTMVQALVLALYAIYISSRVGRGRNSAWVVVVSYVAYWVAYYVSLFLSRIREYMADYASAQITERPNDLSRALVKIAYGLAKTQTVGDPQGVPVTQPQSVPPQVGQAGFPGTMLPGRAVPANMYTKLQDQNRSPLTSLGLFSRQARRSMTQTTVTPAFSAANLGAFGVMGVASMRCAVAWSGADGLANPETFTTAARWELFNPWAKIAEVCSTHPLTALRIKALQKLNRIWGKVDEFDFSRVRPAKYKFFARDLFVMSLPILGALLGGGLLWVIDSASISTASGIGPDLLPFFGLAVGRFIQILITYPSEKTPSTVIRLLGEVQMSHVKPIPVALEGVLTGRVSPGIAWASDYVLQDESGFIVCLMKQPLAIFQIAFGLLEAEQHVGRRVRVYGWYRRFNAPFIEVSHIEIMGTGEKVRAWYYPGVLWGNGLIAVALLAGVVAFWH